MKREQLTEYFYLRQAFFTYFSQKQLIFQKNMFFWLKFKQI